MGVGTSGLRFAVPSEASELLVMGTSVVPSDSGLLDTVLPCTLGSKIKPGADGRCTGLARQLWDSPSCTFSWQAAPQTSTTSTPLLRETAEGCGRILLLSGCRTTADVHVEMYLAVPVVQTCLSVCLQGCLSTRPLLRPTDLFFNHCCMSD